MTGPEHYAEAERLLRQSDQHDSAYRSAAAARSLALAQVHATLAIASADVLDTAVLARAVVAEQLIAERRS